MACFARTILVTFPVISLAVSASIGPHSVLEAPLAPKVEVRRATPADSAIMSNITITAFQDAPNFRYVRQFYDQYPHDAYDCLNAELRRILASPKIIGHIGLVPAYEPPHEMTAVSAALWELPKSMRSIVPLDHGALNIQTLTSNACKNRDVNMTRAIDLVRQSNHMERYLNHAYPPKQQLYLASVGTLPAYQGHDIAGHLLRKGLSMPHDVPDDELPDTLYAALIATPAGEPLYWENGYSSIKNMTLHTLDTHEHFRFDIMVKQLRPRRRFLP